MPEITTCNEEIAVLLGSRRPVRLIATLGRVLAVSGLDLALFSVGRTIALDVCLALAQRVSGKWRYTYRILLLQRIF